MGEQNAAIQQYGVIPTPPHPRPPRPPPPPPPPRPPPRKFYLPCQDLLADERRREFLNTCVPLCKASIIGDWKAAKRILENNRSLVRYCITENFETALHIAASAESTDFMDELLKMMNKEDLLLQTKSGDTALCLAAGAGNVKMARILVDGNQNLAYSVEYLLDKKLELKNENRYERLTPRNENLLTISGMEGLMPLSVAALYGKGEMVKYLYEKFNVGGPEWNTFSKQWVLLKCVNINRFDIALQIIDKHGELGQSENILQALAMKPLAFNESKSQSIFAVIRKSEAKESEAMQLLKRVWINIAERPKDEVDRILKGSRRILKDGRVSPILFVATELGNTDFVAALIREYPDLIWKKNDNNQSIFHIAVSHRQENIYAMLHQIGSMKDLITRLRDMDCNNILHLVGKTAEKNQHQNVSGVAFQMQRELLWFKEVYSMVPPHYREEKNKDGLTPYELFTDNHKNLVSEGEKWMKDTASQCMVVAALIATVVFAVAFTIPGGYNQNNGLPVFLWKGPFIVFVILDAISLMLSSTSILVFLSILTASRYAQEDFAKSLPQKLLIGLTTLFLSIATMMIAFSVSFFVLYQEQLIMVAIFISIVAVIPVISFTILHHGLLMDVFQSTHSAQLLFQPKKQLFEYQNPRY